MSKRNKKETSNRAKQAQRMLKIYGQDVEKGTEQRISNARKSLEISDPLLVEAMGLRRDKVSSLNK